MFDDSVVQGGWLHVSSTSGDLHPCGGGTSVCYTYQAACWCMSGNGKARAQSSSMCGMAQLWLLLFHHHCCYFVTCVSCQQPASCVTVSPRTIEISENVIGIYQSALSALVIAKYRVLLLR
jgi:hypothetical protein